MPLDFNQWALSVRSKVFKSVYFIVLKLFNICYIISLTSEELTTYEIQGSESRGVSAITHAGFVSGEVIQKNLSFITKVSSGGGGSSSSGGGGGGGAKPKPKANPPVEVSVLGVATTTSSTSQPIVALSVEELRMELQKQIIFLLTQLIALLQAKGTSV